MKSFIPGAKEIDKRWHVVDAQGQTLGRLATRVARILTGKDKPIYTPFLDTGDHVIIINAEKVVMTGNKLSEKLYRHHTGYPGGLREVAADVVLAKEPEKLFERSCYRDAAQNQTRAGDAQKTSNLQGAPSPSSGSATAGAGSVRIASGLHVGLMIC